MIGCFGKETENYAYEHVPDAFVRRVLTDPIEEPAQLYGSGVVP